MHVHSTDDAPAAVGPYSQAVSVDGWLYTAGQIALDPSTGALVGGGIEEQAVQVMKNLRAVLASADADFSNVVRTTIYLLDMSSFQTVNGVYAAALGSHRPARSTVAVSELPLGGLVEIDMVARL